MKVYLYTDFKEQSKELKRVPYIMIDDKRIQIFIDRIHVTKEGTWIELTDFPTPILLTENTIMEFIHD